MNAKETNFAYKVRHALNENLDLLPETTAARLESARKNALGKKKRSLSVRAHNTQTVLAGHAGNFLEQPFSWMSRFSVAMPLVLGVVLFFGLYQYEQQQRISEIAEFDAAVLSDDLPLTAYIDHGFNAYLAKRGE
ncbi:DUF3619 family protein [soil metagenome]